MVGATSKAPGADLHRENRQLRYRGIQTMELSDSDRPVSFSSTSSSASSRDSHCSFGSRTTLVSNSHLGLFNQDKESGAIKLELSPAHRFPNKELQKNNLVEQPASEGTGSLARRSNMPRKVESKETSKNCVMSLIIEPTSPKLLYVDRVVQEILDTERTYVQDLKSIVKVSLSVSSYVQSIPNDTFLGVILVQFRVGLFRIAPVICKEFDMMKTPQRYCFYCKGCHRCQQCGQFTVESRNK